MTRFRFLLPTMALLFLACSGDSSTSGPADDGPGPSDPESQKVAEVFVEGSVTMLWDTGVSTRLTARATDSSGEAIPGVTFEWTVRDPEVATVWDGVVTAVADGWTEAMAATQGVSDGVSIVVVTPDGPRDRMDCIACHADAYLGRHGGTNTPETCLQCHTGPTWSGGDFDHPAVANGFELLGAHASLSCTACHEADGTPRYPGVADDECIACHQADYDARHGGSGLPTTCLDCHTRDSWTGVTFDHAAAANGFELLGAHASLSCAACHEADGTPRYPGVADDECIACHQADYDAQHAGSGYPTACLECHTRDAWAGATFDHDFPIFFGRHQGRWEGCPTCHTNETDYSDFTCFACHVHDQSRMDDKHSGVLGYAYDSSLCYACHPQGEAG
jgi:hypothetical protein